MGTNWHFFLLFVATVIYYGGMCRFACAMDNTISTTAGASVQSVRSYLFPEHVESVTDEAISGYDPSVKSPCSVENIPSSGDVFVNCRARNISRIDPRWFPVNTTIISLDSNNIDRIENNTFHHLGLLRNLSMCCSNVAKIQTNALRGLRNLEYLNLENNKLPLKYMAFPKTMFGHVPNLRHLYIQYNMNMDSGTKHMSMDDKKNCSEVPPYSHYLDIFDLDLESLSIDIFPHVCLGEEFSRFQNLTNLQLHGSISGGYVFLTNDTFLGLRNVKLAHLSLTRFMQPVIRSTELGLFRHLHHLDALAMAYCHFGNQIVAKLMWPFVNKTMSFLHLSYIGLHHDIQTPRNVFEDGTIGKETTEYLGKICVADFAWVYSGLLAVEQEALILPTWSRCLRKVDFSGNDFSIIGQWKASYFYVVTFSALESITLTTHVPYGTSYQIDAEILDETTQKKENLPTSLWSAVPKYYSVNTTGVKDDVTTHMEAKNSRDSDDYVDIDANDVTGSLKQIGAAVRKNPQVFSDHDNLQKHDSSVKSWFSQGQLLVWIPNKMKRVRFVYMADGTVFGDDTTVVFKGTDNLLEVYVTYTPKFFDSSARILGLERTKLFDFSYSLLRVRQDFFDDFPGTEILVLRSIFPNDYFDTVMPCKQVIRKMSRLRYLDISNNGLTFLLPETFSANPQLKQIILSQNRFSTIPFQLYLTPKLMALDLSHNAILYLDEGDRSAIETQAAKVDAFYLKLEGNGLVCVCSQMMFLVWLDRTAAILDKDGNYSCTSQDGWLSHTVPNKDLLGFWRQCNGCTYLTARFRCAIKAFMLRLMFPQFRPLTPRDYRTDVIVCYADDDFRFVRNILLGFLENELHLRTHIHQRDLPVGGHIDDHIHQAIENSWRIMLVITETFLKRYDMADIMMKFACHAVGPANQGRVFALVEQSQLNLIPGNLHAVLEDDRIIVIYNLNDPLGYEHKQSIKNCLRPDN